VVRSVLIKLAMLSTTLSLVVWMGWTVPQDRGEASLPGEATIDSDPQDTSPSQVVALKDRSERVKTQLDVNQATVREFDQLPGIGPALAQRIIDHRRSHGRFTTVEDLLLVKGIGSKKLERFRGLVTVNNQTGPDG
jgi:competence protein ComEA